ncbi:hypothetical protein Hanom_Chr12g01162651 [Helianthus anomalus]
MVLKLFLRSGFCKGGGLLIFESGRGCFLGVVATGRTSCVVSVGLITCTACLFDYRCLMGLYSGADSAPWCPLVSGVPRCGD